MILQDFENEYVLIFKKEIHKEFEFIKDRENVKYEVIHSNSKLFLSQVLLLYYLYKNKCDYYLFFAFPSPALFFNKGIVNAVHDMTPWLYPETMSKKGLYYFKILITLAKYKSKFIITVSNNSKKEIQHILGIPLEKINVIYNGVDDRYFESSEDDNKQYLSDKYHLSEKYFLCVGTVEPRKNLKLLVDAYIELKKEINFDYKLVVTGRKGWKYGPIFEKIKSYGLENDIIFTGFIEEEDLVYIYKYAECFIFPSLYEGFGIPAVEAMASGTPTIVSNTSSLPEVVGEESMMFKSNDVEDLKTAIKKFISLDIKTKEKLKEYGKSRAKLFNWQVESEKLLSILTKLDGE